MLDGPNCWWCFNPTLVRLRQIDCPPGTQYQRGFQSHAGSIEARVGRGLAGRVQRFQSHAGSIEAPVEDPDQPG